VAALPPTSFGLYDFKTFYCNCKDQAGAGIDEFFKQLDWEGWAFWKIKYDIMDYEKSDKEHKLNNLLDGFHARAQHTAKYTFGKLAVMGAEGKWEIMGIWLMRGQVIPDGLTKEHAQWEYYKPSKLDPRKNKEHEMLVRQYFSMKGGETIEGLEVRKVFW